MQHVQLTRRSLLLGSAAVLGSSVPVSALATPAPVPAPRIRQPTDLTIYVSNSPELEGALRLVNKHQDALSDKRVVIQLAPGEYFSNVGIAA